MYTEFQLDWLRDDLVMALKSSSCGLFRMVGLFRTREYYILGQKRGQVRFFLTFFEAKTSLRSLACTATTATLLLTTVPCPKRVTSVRNVKAG